MVTPLEDLKLRLCTTSPNDAEQFRRNVADTFNLLGLKLTDISRRMGVSKPTVQRWMDGASAPHPLARSSVHKELLGLIAEKEVTSV